MICTRRSRAHGRQGEPTGTYSSSFSFLIGCNGNTSVSVSAIGNDRDIVYNSTQKFLPQSILANQIWTEILKLVVCEQG